jgi:hypothetical protein
MRFNSYINEARYENEGRKTGISLEKAVELVKSNCNKIIKYYNNSNNNRIYRGSTSGEYAYAIVDPEQFERRSRNTLNYYTLIIDNSPYWSAYPKRSKSIVCSTNSTRASNYGGTTYVVFPYDNCKIGICPGSDIWDTKTGIINSWDVDIGFEGINDPLMALGLSDTSWETLEKELRSIKKGTAILYNILIDSFKRSKLNNFLSFLQSRISPKRGFNVVPPGNQLPSTREVWVGGDKCILVAGDKYGANIDEFMGMLQ